MEGFKITIKNYRCFEDTSPLQIKFGSGGFKAFVGANNAGKSTVLKFFYEFRDLFRRLTEFNRFTQLLGAPDTKFAFDANGIEDHAELLSNFNARDLTIELELEGKQRQQGDIFKVLVTIERADPASYRIRYFCKDIAIPEFVGQQGPWRFHLRAGGQVFLVQVVDFLDICTALSGAMYIGPFRNAISEAQGSYYDISIGTAFINAWNAWKTGGQRRQNEIVQAVADDIAAIFGFARLEVNMANTSPVNLQVIADGKPYRLRELGGGLAQFFVVLGNVAMRRPQILCIDEPELNLHPSLQITFLTSLASYVQGHVLFSTHSIGLARSTAEEIFTCEREGKKTVVRAFEELRNPAEFLGEMSFSTFKDMGSDGILLVEGVTEVKVIQQILRKFGTDRNLVLIPLGGRQLITAGRVQELEEIKRLSKNVSVLIDSERSVEDAPLEHSRQSFVGDCRSLGFNVCVMSRRAIENYFSQPAIDSALRGKHDAMGYFDSLDANQHGWGKTENWKIARAMSREEWETNDIGMFLSKLGKVA